MKRSSTIIITIVAILVIGAGAYLLFKPSTNNTSSTAPSKSTPSTASKANSPSTRSSTAKITYSDNGFSPTDLTVKSGDTVVIANSSSSDVQMNSNPHPYHTDDADLNVGLVATGQSKSFVVTKIGSFGFHNHLNPGQTGKITIQ